ncbi:dipeptidase [Siminovitchia fortis]|uniref:Membrane dipeptidase n=1 Tax=Siminovitchia fortis TaxID=254758 RepID=A0A443J2S5_9BACI|nr:dipeptidase [Siminovitchia fortis]RWR14626.1 membrane dipeptidase [Siminovitchia fortis]WHY80307.1 dipeptidase [Siminovitchia fortis]
MNIIDLHCDILWKLWESKGKLRFNDSPELDANKERLKKGNVKVQCFAVFIPPEIKTTEQFQSALEQINYYYTEILENNPDIIQIRCWKDILDLKPGQTGAVLTLEGIDCIGNDLQKLSLLNHMGVRSTGLTWNYANLAADGAEEPRGAGLTTFGKQVVRFNNQRKMLTDVSHLSERSFWDVMDLADYPIASHSNAKALCSHPRNLKDRQAEALFEKNGMVHVVFFPEFIAEKEIVTIPDLIKHIDHFCSLGGVRHIGFGSDFDGIDRHIAGLENASKYQNLINELLKYYSEDQVRGFAGQNFLETVSNWKI